MPLPIEEIVVSDPMRIEALRHDAIVAEEAGDGSWLTVADAVTRFGTLWLVPEPAEIPRKVTEVLEDGPPPFAARLIGPDGVAKPAWAFSEIAPSRPRQIVNRLKLRYSWRIDSGEFAVVGADGWIRRRALNDKDWQPNLLSQLSFEQAVESALDIRIAGAQRRLRAPGWVHEFEADLPCPSCGSEIIVLRSLQRLRSGEWRDLYTVVCAGCERVWLHNQLGAAYQRAIEALAMWSLADDDVEEAQPEADRTHSCYVLDLFDESGQTLAHDREWVYVGQTSKPVEERVAQHASGELAGRWTKRFFRGLNEDLTEPHRMAFRSESESKAYERYLAAQLSIAGFGVKGGH